MALVLPYPNKPANGDTLDATVVQANFTAIAQAIQAFDGSQVVAASIQAAALAAAANPITRGLDTINNFVASGVIVSTPSGLNVSITGGTIYVNGNRLPFAGVGSQTLLANKDYYIDIDNLGNVTYLNVANGGAAPTLTTNSVRVAVVVTGATVTSIRQNGLDNITQGIYVAPNLKCVTNSTAPALTNSDQNLASCGLQVTVNVPAITQALVTISLGINSGSDFEFHPEIFLDGALTYSPQPAASIGSASNRAAVRTYTTAVQIPSGSHTISGGVFLAAAISPGLPVNAGSLAVLVNGKVLA